MLDELRQLVEIESPSDDRDGVNRAVDWVEHYARRLGAECERHSQPGFGDHLELRFGGISRRLPVLLIGHLDTVWPLGTLASMPFKVEQGRAWGPGTLDMKGGIVMALNALRLLGLPDTRPDRDVILWLVSDEEVGSTSSRRKTETLAQQASAVLVLEPAQGLYGAAKTWRKGVGGYTVRVRGVASHSGVDFEKGHSAVLELARQILRISEFTDISSGLTVNPGVISGGSRSNVIAGHAVCEVDVRMKCLSDAERVEELMRSLTPFDRECRLVIEGGMNRPPMERTDKVLSLYRKAHDIASDLGFELREEGTGGGSDGNFTAALGISTLDGLGAVGEGAHATHESVLLDELPRRTALLAELINRV